MNMDAAELLEALCAQLIADGTSSHELIAIEFDPDGNKVELLTSKVAHGQGYPDLVSILETIGQSCAHDHIGAQQLRRINFLEEEIKLEMVSRSGDQTIVYAFPLEE
jgi:hypothetical protein